MADTKKIIKKTLENLGDETPEELKDSVEKLTEDIYEHGMLPKDAMGLSNEMVEGIYSYAYRLYNTGKYEPASQLFRLLIMLNPTEAKYLMGLAACFHMEKDWEQAGVTYILCSLIDLKSPVYHYHASDCYQQQGQKDMAINALEACIGRCERNEEFLPLKERAVVNLEALQGKNPAKKKKKKKVVSKKEK